MADELESTHFYTITWIDLLPPLGCSGLTWYSILGSVSLVVSTLLSRAVLPLSKFRERSEERAQFVGQKHFQSFYNWARLGPQRRPPARAAGDLITSANKK
jgi:hypothetical protein